MGFRCKLTARSEDFEKIIKIASEEFRKLLPGDKVPGFEIEEIEEQSGSGHYFVTLGYWAKDNKPRPERVSVSKSIEFITNSSPEDFFNPWRQKFKRVEVDPAKGKAIAIRIYEPPLGVS